MIDIKESIDTIIRNKNCSFRCSSCPLDPICLTLVSRGEDCIAGYATSAAKIVRDNDYDLESSFFEILL